jgi:DNA-binding NarL/FixJ family response regulator
MTSDQTSVDGSSSVIRVLCVDDHPLVRKGLAAILNNEPDMELVAEAENGKSAIELFRKLQPDVTLMDLRMPEVDGLTAIRTIIKEFPEARIIALTSYDGDQDIFNALQAGVRGYLLKEMVHTEVLQSIRQVHAGKRLMITDTAARTHESVLQSALTPREIEVLKLIAQGLSNKEIAHQLGTATGTAKIHVQNIIEKLSASDRTQAVTIAVQRGIVHL